MRSQTRWAAYLMAAAGFIAPLLATQTASAQYVYVAGGPVGDGPRFRGGINLEGGLIAVPGVVNVGDISLVGSSGIQFNNQWALYANFGLDVIAGNFTGFGGMLGVMADYTFPGVPLAVAAGPEVGAFGPISQATDNGNTNVNGAAGGAFYGARLRFTYYPILVRNSWNPRRRHGLALGLDVRLLEGAFGASSSSTSVGSNDAFGIAPQLFIGYTSL